MTNPSKSAERLKNNMFWIKQYCKSFNLKLIGTEIYEGSKKIGEIDLYNEFVFFDQEKFLFRHLGCAMIENFKLHGESNE